MKILILGDGNFSFTLAFANQVADKDGNIANYLSTTIVDKVYSTSFDSYKQLAKYSDCYDILSKISKHKFVTVLHEINAWELSLHFEEKFDLILWNHPHLGTEDFRLHSFLMAHFFHSCTKVLKSTGLVRLSLVQGQESRWKVAEQAKKAGLVLLDLYLFDEDLWPGYIVKRNKHGGSFKNLHTRRHTRSLMKSCVYTFGYPTEVNPGISSDDLQAQLNQYFGQDYQSKFDSKTLNTAALSQEKTTTLGMDLKLRGSQSKIEQKLKRLGVIPVDLQCTYCQKTLLTPRAYRQHVHTVHELQKFGSDWAPDRPKTIECYCGKLFAGQEALYQHKVNKHTKLDLKDLGLQSAPEVTKGDEVQERDSEYDYIPCSVCGQSRLVGDYGTILHLEGLKPCIEKEMKCPGCKGAFIEQRALLQHWKFCRLKLNLQ